jgi:signal recognition particle GTPase
VSLQERDCASQKADIFRQDMAMSNPERQKDMAKNLQAGKFSIRDWREQLSNVMGM